MIQTKDLGYNNRFWQSGLAFCFAIIVLMLVIGSGVSAFAGGNGTSVNPYQIATTADFASMGGTANVFYILNNDLDFGGGSMATGISSGDDFNGNGHLLMNGVVISQGGSYTIFQAVSPISGTVSIHDVGIVLDSGGTGGGTGIVTEADGNGMSVYLSEVFVTGGPITWSGAGQGHGVFTGGSGNTVIIGVNLGSNLQWNAGNGGGSSVFHGYSGTPGNVVQYSWATNYTNVAADVFGGQDSHPGDATGSFYNGGSTAWTGATAATLSQMQTESTYTNAGWVFNATEWKMSSPTGIWGGMPIWYNIEDPATAPPVASFTANVTSGTVPFAVNLTDTSTQTPTSWSWKDNGVQVATVQNPGLLFLTGDIGNNNITLTATNSFGSNTSAITDIQVYVPVTSVATTLSGSLTVGSNLSATNLQPAGASVNYQWVWCATSNGAYQSIPSATGPSYTVTSTYQGDYIELLASGTNFYSGSVYSVTRGPVGMAPVTPVASFTANVTSGTAPFSVQFTDTSTNSPTSWSWEINGLPFSSLENLLWVFSSVGTYNITLLATNGGGTGTSGITQFVVTPPTVTGAGIGADVASGTANAPVAVNFTAYFNTTNTAFINATPGSTAWELVSAPYGQRNISLGNYDILNPTFLAAGTYDLMATFTTNGTVGTQNETATLNYVVKGSAPQIQWTQNDYVTTVQTLTTGQTVYFSGNTAPLGQAATPFAVNVQIDRIDPVTGTAYAVLWPGCNFTSLSNGYIASVATVSPASSHSPGRWVDLSGADVSIQGSAVLNTPGTYVIYLTFEDANGGLPVDDGLQNQLIVSSAACRGRKPDYSRIRGKLGAGQYRSRMVLRHSPVRLCWMHDRTLHDHEAP